MAVPNYSGSAESDWVKQVDYSGTAPPDVSSQKYKIPLFGADSSSAELDVEENSVVVEIVEVSFPTLLEDYVGKSKWLSSTNDQPT